MRILYTLKHLKYFLSVVEHQHFGHAAEANFVTQPTLSAAIREFEEILGLRLLERTKRKVLVTPVGHHVAEQAREILKKAQDLDDFCRTQTAPLSGPLRLGIIPTIAPFLLPKIMPPLRQEFQDLSLYLHEKQTAVLLQDLENGLLDLAILALPYELPQMESMVFAHDPFFMALPADHPMATQKQITRADLEKVDLLLLEEGHCLRDHALNACQIMTKPKPMDFGATSLHTLIEMVAGGMGVTLVPQMAVATDLVKHSSVTTIALEEDLPDRQIALVWRKTSGLKEDFCKLARFLEQLDVT